MLQIAAKEFLEIWVKFEHARRLAGTKKGKIADGPETNFLVEVLCKLNGHCNYMNLKVSASLSEKLLSWLKDPGNYRIWHATGYTMPKEPPFVDFETINKYLQDIAASIHQEIAPIRLAIAPLGKNKFLDRDRLFGEKVFVVFEEAREDIQNAGNCLALGLNNAAVYYLMCVVERALRRLADALEVVVVKKAIPIELGTWNDVITALQDKINTGAPRANAAGLIRLNLCSAALIEFRAIEHFWRNKVMHTRATYDDLAAENAFNHVERFMKNMADLIGS